MSEPDVGGARRLRIGMRLIDKLVDATSAHPGRTLVVAALVAAALWSLAARVKLRADLRELLPQGSASYAAYERQAARVEQGANLLVIVESPDRAANVRFVDELARALESKRAACRGACTDPIAYIESDWREAHAFFQDNAWLYLRRSDLEELDAELGRRMAVESGLVVDLEDRKKSDEPSRPLVEELRSRRVQAESALRALDPFPSGHFETADGSAAGLRIVSSLQGTGDVGGEALLAMVEQTVHELSPARHHPAMVVGYGGDIPNALEERRSVASDALWSTLLAAALILGGVAWVFRGPRALAVIAAPVIIGVGGAYAFAALAFGYINSSGAFLGAIIFGNGINYPIVLLARYQDFRGRGISPPEARRQAVRNAFRAELVGALVAAIAYGSLTVTDFRGFRQFGAIGFVGMLLVWIASIPLVPAVVAWTERGRTPEVPRGESTMRRWAGTLQRHASVTLLTSLLLAVALAVPLARWLQDPWEYDFSRLGSRATKHQGAGRWSVRAEEVFGGKSRMAGALLLADTPEQAPRLAAAIRERDRTLPGAPLLERVLTIGDLLPGSPKAQSEALAIVERIGRRLRRIHAEADLSAEDRRELEAIFPRPGLRPLGVADLPRALQRPFTEKNGVVGAVLYVQPRANVSLSSGRTLLRLAAVTDRVTLADGTVVETASRAGVFAQIFRSMAHDGPLATGVSLASVIVVVLFATGNLRGAFAVLSSLMLGVLGMLGAAAVFGERLNFLSFVALPITFGIGSEYPFNIYDRTRLLHGDVAGALERSGAAVALCSFTTTVGYGSLLFADSQALQSFGRLAIGGEIACLAAALVYLPALLARMRRGPS